jgi:hypothetical protein
MSRTTLAAFAVLLLILLATGTYAVIGLSTPGDPMPTEGYVALAIGAVVTILVGIALMSLVFYSSRRGYDEPPHLRDDGPGGS